MTASTGRTRDEVETSFREGRYFAPHQAVEFGIIDQVVEPGKSLKDLPSFLRLMNQHQRSVDFTTTKHTALFPAETTT